MKFSRLVVDYLAYRRALGNRFRIEEFILRSLCRHLGDPQLDDIDGNKIVGFLLNDRSSLCAAARKRRTLAGLYRYAHLRRHETLPVLPILPSDPPSSFVPYIYSEGDLRRLLDAIPRVCTVAQCRVEGYAFRALLLTLYGAALRLGEALRLNDVDVDLDEALLAIHESKFFKTRVVPISKDLVGVLAEYRAHRDRLHAAHSDAHFFRLRTGAPMNHGIIQRTFVRLRTAAGILREGGSHNQPRLHDLRHAAAVHRLERWYQTGVDLQRQLPRLATHLGHQDLSGTQRYLTLTPELLHAASRRFEQYAMEHYHE